MRHSWRAEQLLHLPRHRGQETHWHASQTSWKQTAHNSFLCGPSTSNCAEESTHPQPCRNQSGLVVLPGRRLRWFAPWKNGERVRPPNGWRSGRSAHLQASANSLKFVPRGCPCIHFSPVIVKNRNGLLSILISVALNGEDASKLHLEKTSEAFNLRPNQRTCVRGRKKPSVGKTLCWRIWLRCYHLWLSFWRAASIVGSNPCVALLSFKIFFVSHPEHLLSFKLAISHRKYGVPLSLGC